MGHSPKALAVLALAAAGITGWTLLEMTKQGNLLLWLSAFALC